MNESTIDVVARKELADAAQVITAMAMRLQAMLNRIVLLERRLSEIEDLHLDELRSIHVES